MRLAGAQIGPDRPLFLIAGPCVVESPQLTLDIAGELKAITGALGIPFVFKASYDKANRSSRSSFRGPGMEQGLKVLGNREQITVAVSNLVANAVNYSPERSSVLIAARAVDNDMVEISVTDQGIGIPSTEIDRIFERFYRVDPARHRSTGGTGLGLSIVKHVAATHGGDIRVWSVEGQGSTFTLSLPRKNQEGRP